MSTHQAAYEVLAADLEAQGIDVEAVKTAIKNHKIETPSWGYANSGTRFKAFAWPGAAGWRGMLTPAWQAPAGPGLVWV